MYIILFIIILFFILYKVNHNKVEFFYPAWQDHVIYNTLSKRLKIGVWKGWININGFQMVNKFINITNCEIRLFETNEKLLESLLIDKSIDIAIVTEAVYGIFVLSHLSKDLNNLTKETILKNKKIINKKLNSRRLYTFYKIYRILVVNNFKINKSSDINNKVIQITNISNDIYKLDLDLLKNYKYIQVFKERDRSVDMYGSLRDLMYKIDGYFTEYDNPNKTLRFISEFNNSTIIDLYGPEVLFPSPKELLNKYFFLRKDKIDLSHYPSIVQRRKQSFEYNNIHLNPNKANCYSYKVLLVTRSDVDNESIYLFTKKLYDNFDFLKENIPYFGDFSKKDMFQSTLSDILELHNAIYNPL